MFYLFYLSLYNINDTTEYLFISDGFLCGAEGVADISKTGLGAGSANARRLKTSEQCSEHD